MIGFRHVPWFGCCKADEWLLEGEGEEYVSYNTAISSVTGYFVQCALSNLSPLVWTKFGCTEWVSNGWPTERGEGFKMLKSFIFTHSFEGVYSTVHYDMAWCVYLCSESIWFCQTMFLAVTEKSNTHMFFLIRAKSRLQLCHWEFPSLWALTETQPLTDEAQPAPVCETPPLSPAPCLTTSALH